MEPDIEVGWIIQVTTRAKLHGQTILNTFHYRADAATVGYVDPLKTLIAQFNSSVQTAMATAQSNELEYLATVAQVIWPNRYIAVSDSTDMEPAGSVEESSLPSVCAAIVRRRSIVAARDGYGRIYVAGIPITREVDSQINATEIAALSLVGANMLDPIDGTPVYLYTPILYDRLEPEASKEFVEWEVDPIIRVQRRREVGVGF